MGLAVLSGCLAKLHVALKKSVPRLIFTVPIHADVAVPADVTLHVCVALHVCVQRTV